VPTVRANAPRENGAAIASRIAGAPLRQLEGGHLFVLQDPSATPAVIEFLQERG
jgi:hypothetical protein